MPAKAWVLGDAVVISYQNQTGAYPCSGGAPANVAVGIARLGGTKWVYRSGGDDPFGALMQKNAANWRSRYHVSEAR